MNVLFVIQTFPSSSLPGMGQGLEEKQERDSCNGFCLKFFEVSSLTQ